MAKYISGITFITGTSANQAPPSDFPHMMDISTNQNARLGGLFIYLCYQRTNDIKKALTGVTLVAHYSSTIPTPPGYTQLEQDLNDRAGGKWIYACTTADSSLPPLTDITIVAGGSRHTYPEDDTWVRVNQDTNDGAGGDFIYICYKRQSP